MCERRIGKVGANAFEPQAPDRSFERLVFVRKEPMYVLPRVAERGGDRAG